MRRATTLMTMLVLVVAAAAVAPAAAAGQADADANSSTNASADVAPGEQFAGVVGVTEAEFEGEMAERTFGVKVAQEASAEAQSDVVAEQLGDVQQRVEELEQREQELREARENGSMTEGEFRAEMAVVATEKETAARLATHSENAASGLPEDTLAERGVDVTAIAELRQRASAIGGGNVSAIARSIAGDSVGPTAQVEIGAEGGVSVDVPGIEAGADGNGEAGAESSGENENGSGAEAEAGSEAGVESGDNTSVDSETELDAETDGENTSVEGGSETSVSTDL